MLLLLDYVGDLAPLLIRRVNARWVVCTACTNHTANTGQGAAICFAAVMEQVANILCACCRDSLCHSNGMLREGSK